MKYNVIYADPPWEYRLSHKLEKFSCAEKHYRTMNIDDIYNLNVASLAAKDCILFYG